MKLLPLFVLLSLLMTYQFMFASWVAPTQTPPNANIEAPLNVGNSTQIKSGNIGIDGATVFTGSPTIQFYDETPGEVGFWLHNNSNRFYLLADRNRDSSWSGESPWPMELFASTTSSGDWVRFSGQVRADEICSYNGTGCVNTTDLNTGSPTYYPNVGVVRVAGWNSFPTNTTTWPSGTAINPAGLPSASYGSEYNDATFTSTNYDACFITTEYTHIRDDETFTGGGGCELTRVNTTTGEWRIRAIAAKRNVTECKVSCIGW